MPRSAERRGSRRNGSDGEDRHGERAWLPAVEGPPAVSPDSIALNALESAALAGQPSSGQSRPITAWLNVLVVDRHEIYRRGLVDSLRSLPEVSQVAEADSVVEARGHPAFSESDVVIIEHDLPGACEFIVEARDCVGAGVIVCFSKWDRGAAVACVEAGASGVLAKEILTPEALGTGLDAVANGCAIVTRDLLCRLAAPTEGDPATEHSAPSTLTPRERSVLRLIADGQGTREVAGTLAYSERTVKNVLHDIGTKLGARSRSHAVAQAVREGLI